MWPDRRLIDLLEIEHPIIQAPMLGSAGPALAACVSNAGGLGFVACGDLPAASIRELSEEMRGLSNNRFSMNFFVLSQMPSAGPDAMAVAKERLSPFYEELGLGPVGEDLPEPSLGFTMEKAELVAELQPAVVSFHFGLPDSASVLLLKEAGIVIMCSATTVAEARVLEEAGVDIVIAQGWEAGGHRGSHEPNRPGDGVGTMALVPQVADAVSVPVVAAGGIGDGRGIAAAFALGACGVQIGTGFLSCPKSLINPARRELLANASDSDTMVTDAVSGRSARAVRSPYAEALATEAGKLPDFPLLYGLTQPMLDAAAEQGNSAVSFHLYGQAAALNRALPAQDVVERLVAEARDVFERLTL